MAKAQSIAEWLREQFDGDHPPCRAGTELVRELYAMAKKEGITTGGMHGFFYNNFRPAVQEYCGIDDLGYVYSEVIASPVDAPADDDGQEELEEEPDDDQEEGDPDVMHVDPRLRQAAAQETRARAELGRHVVLCKWGCGRGVDARVYPEHLEQEDPPVYSCGVCREGQAPVDPSTPMAERTNPLRWVDEANDRARSRIQEEEEAGQRERNRELARRIEELARLRRKEAHPPEDPFVMYVSGPWGQLMIERAEGGDRARLEGYLPDDLVDELVGELLGRYYPLGPRGK